MGYRHEYLQYKAAVDLSRKYIKHQDVNDIYFGNKYIDNNYTNIPSIRFNVYNKKPKSFLKSNQILPKRIGNFTTDVTEFIPKNEAREEDPYLLSRPIIGGIQIQSSLFNGPSDWGTLGCILKRNNIIYGITNFHVSFGDIADFVPPNTNAQILQPKTRSFGEVIGNTNSIYNKYLDYSLFKINTEFDDTQSINGYEGYINGFVNPFENMSMFKFGAATGKTFGTFDARSIINKHRIVIRYNPHGPNDSSRISAPGDSGSIWLTRPNDGLGNLRMVALHYGGDQNHNIAFASLFSSIWASIVAKTP